MNTNCNILIKFNNNTKIINININNKIKSIIDLLYLQKYNKLIYFTNQTKILELDKTFIDYNINNNDFININFKLLGGRRLPPALKASQVVNEKILKETGVEGVHWFGLIIYINMLRKEAKKSVKDEKDFEDVNKKIMELFEKDLQLKGKGKIADIIITFAEEAKTKRSKGKKS